MEYAIEMHTVILEICLILFTYISKMKKVHEIEPEKQSHLNILKEITGLCM